MPNYGFDENEVVKSVVDLIDKDGFHKQMNMVPDEDSSNQQQTDHIASGILYSENAASVYTVYIYVTNAPSETFIYAIPHSQPIINDFTFDIGDNFNSDCYYLTGAQLIPNINVKYLTHEIDTNENPVEAVYYEIYKCTTNGVILDRTNDYISFGK